jgi:hypothetical protein
MSSPSCGIVSSVSRESDWLPVTPVCSSPKWPGVTITSDSATEPRRIATLSAPFTSSGNRTSPIVTGW